MIRKYPIGIQSFRKIREDNYLYVDKTEIIHRLVSSGAYYFLSRPRRFGKSLLISTIKELFSCSRELFEGLWIHDHWNWEQQHPVIHLRLSQIDYQQIGLYNALNREMEHLAVELQITLSETELKSRFRELIRKAATKEKVVILVDEYDKPLIDYLDNPEKIKENREVFKSFYSVLKDADDQIQFLLFTGVSRFSKVSIFSDLNNLEDITLDRNFNSIVGITQQELENYFSREISEMSLEFNIARNQLLDEIKEWYNGYVWSGKETLYNPFSLLNFMKKRSREFVNYWIATGAPSFLIKEIRQHPDRFIFSEKEILVGPEGVEDLFVEAINPVTMMFQTGFLTIKQYDTENDLYTLVYPNKEVERSVLTHLTAAYSFGETAFVQPSITGLKTALQKNDIKKVISIVDTLFANIPNPLWQGHTEAFFHGLIHNTFQLLGISMQSETYNATGRMDAVIKTLTHIYVFEFKLNQTASKAIDQIFNREYLKPFKTDPRKKVAIGVNFSSEKKAVADYEIMEVREQTPPN